jgi:anti-sigma B factor antagonist
VRLADVQFTVRGPLVIACLTGEVDLSNTDSIGAAILEAVPHQSVALVLDLGAIEYLDSAGIQLIYRLREMLRTRSQMLRLLIPSGSLANDALRLAGVSEHLDTFETLDDALLDGS